MIDIQKRFADFSSRAHQRVLLFAGGSTGSVFFHSLVNDAEGILCLPSICDMRLVARRHIKTKEAIFEILQSRTKFKFVISKEKTTRFGDYSNFHKFDVRKFKTCLERLTTHFPTGDVKSVSNIIHFSYAHATNLNLENIHTIFEHPHNLSDGATNEFLKAYGKPTFLLTIREPIAQVNSFFSYQIKNKNLDYNACTKKLIALMNVGLEFSKHPEKFELFKLEDMHNEPEKTIERMAKILKTDDVAALNQSKIGDSDYKNLSAFNGEITGFNRKKYGKKTNILSDDDKALIDYLFKEQYEMFGYERANIVTNHDIFENHFLGIMPKDTMSQNDEKLKRKQLLINKKKEISRSYKYEFDSRISLAKLFKNIFA